MVDSYNTKCQNFIVFIQIITSHINHNFDFSLSRHKPTNYISRCFVQHPQDLKGVALNVKHELISYKLNNVWTKMSNGKVRKEKDFCLAFLIYPKNQ
jgi:hypothetical protein